MDSETQVEDTGEFPTACPPSPRRVHVQFAARSDVGKHRKNNEDHYLVGTIQRVQQVLETNLPLTSLPSLLNETGYTMMIADGMGGMASGEEASRLAIITGLELVRDTAKWNMRFGENNEPAELVEKLQAYYEEVNRRVASEASRHPSKLGMGTTLTVAYSVNAYLFIVHAGDSRTYLHHGGLLQQITHDHTLAQELVQAGRLGSNDAKQHHWRHVLTNYVGNPAGGIEAEIHQLRLDHGDRLLLCSDGLSEMVDDAEIASILARAKNPTRACEKLVQAALQAGGRDNVTVIVAQYRFDDA